MSDYDVENMLGDRKPEWNPGKKKKPVRRGSAPVPATRPTQRTEWKASNGIYDYLAATFRDAPVYVMQGAPLIAKLLRDRVEADPTVSKKIRKESERDEPAKPRDEHIIQDIVEYMIKRFWATVPNDQRTNAFNNFLKDEWWVPLAEESVNHQRLLRLDDSTATPGGAQGMDDPFYDAFMNAKRRHPAGKALPLRERLALARAHHEQESN